MSGAPPTGDGGAAASRSPVGAIGDIAVGRRGSAAVGRRGSAAVGRRGSAALRLHVTLLVGLSVCVTAFCLETIRALDGNTFSWLYVFEWPIFAGYGVYMWWHLLTGHDLAPRPDARRLVQRPTPNPRRQECAESGSAEEDRAALAAWQRYLVDLGETDTAPSPED